MKSRTLHKVIVAGGFCIFLVLIAFLLQYTVRPLSSIPNDVVDQRIPTLTSGTTTIYLLIARTEEEKTKGLGGLSALHPTQGMLFFFDKPDFYQIWMKDMDFPIDIIWLDPDFKIIDYKENATPESFPAVFAPHEKSLYVLEVNSGFVQAHGFNIGTVLEFHP